MLQVFPGPGYRQFILCPTPTLRHVRAAQDYPLESQHQQMRFGSTDFGQNYHNLMAKELSRTGCYNVN